MPIFRLLSDHLRGVFERENPEENDQLASVAAIMSLHSEPSSIFLNALEDRLRVASPPIPEIPNGRSLRVRSDQGFRFIAVGATAAIVAVLLVLTPWTGGDDPGTDLVAAYVLNTAYTNLLATDSVRFEVVGGSNIGICGTGFNTPLTAEERASLSPERAGTTVGIVITCGLGSYEFSETGEYDFVRSRYRAVRSNLGDPIAIANDGSTFPPRTIERIFSDGQVFIKEDDAPWKVQHATSLFTPFVLEGRIAIPDGRLDVLTAQYDSVEVLDDGGNGDIPLSHYRASRVLPDGKSTEVSEVWVAKSDGLPRRAVIQLREPFSVEAEVGLANLEDRLADPASDVYEYRNDPIFVRGPQPIERVVIRTYTFSEFNAPVDISLPTVPE